MELCGIKHGGSEYNGALGAAVGILPGILPDLPGFETMDG
jgi:hypothetical protein